MSSSFSFDIRNENAEEYESYYRKKIITAFMKMCGRHFLLVNKNLTNRHLVASSEAVDEDKLDDDCEISEKSFEITRKLLNTLCSSDQETSFSEICKRLKSKSATLSVTSFTKLEAVGLIMTLAIMNESNSKKTNLIEARKDLSKLHESHKQEVTELRKHFEEKLADCDTRATAYVASKMSPKHI
ncbi:unnamed protein product [Didymodactylos carnosus]|uniref:Uncharacterized protein n=1 Tax=Didymodactylos carnosus TaxID=1234261 RepID=A0A8S2D5I2_9BILA|nr:unnamed protein product [Didymodactylos carnosus]CAF3666891.1 unnamed protein product [Didymodactylos carnosus]